MSMKLDELKKKLADFKGQTAVKQEWLKKMQDSKKALTDKMQIFLLACDMQQYQETAAQITTLDRQIEMLQEFLKHVQTTSYEVYPFSKQDILDSWQQAESTHIKKIDKIFAETEAMRDAYIQKCQELETAIEKYAEARTCYWPLFPDSEVKRLKGAYDSLMPDIKFWATEKLNVDEF